MKALAWFLPIVLVLPSPREAGAEGLKAGAAVIDVTPEKFPVLVNGNMLANRATRATSKISARAIALDNGAERVAIVVVDSCMMGRELLDEAKALAAERTKIRPDRMLISATHTHTGPSSMGCLGTDADPAYVPFLREKLAQAVAAAEANLEPAKVGWAVKDAGDFTALRQWILRPDRIATDPFGNPTIRSNMHAGANPDNAIGESGPEDPALSLLSIQAADGRPIAVLANFSMHYFSGVPALNADYYGMFCEGLQDRVGHAEGDHPPFVAAMSHGCSGDIWRRDYTKPAPPKGQEPTIGSYTQGLLDIAWSALQGLSHEDVTDLAMAERRIRMKYRVPDAQRLEWARRIVAAMGDRPPKTTEEVYAREQIFLHERQSTDVVVQAIRVGEVGIASTPTETYALTGLKIKLRSPLPKTMVIELANGGDGYIPPPEMHRLGGYNTWAARSAGLEVEAEPKIAEADIELLEAVSGKPRRPYVQGRGPASKAILAAKPAAYWRLDEFAAPRAVDASGNRRDAFYEPGVLYFLEGPRSDAFVTEGETNRATHFVGGRLEARLDGLKDRYSVSLWFWNGMPVEGRGVAGWIFSRGRDYGLGPDGDHVGLGGKANAPGKLIFLHGDGDGDGSGPVGGRTEVKRWTWNHLLFVRDGDRVRIHLNGDPNPEVDVTSPAKVPPSFDRVFFGGRSDHADGWEGRLDEIAVFDRALSPEEAKALSAR